MTDTAKLQADIDAYERKLKKAQREQDSALWALAIAKEDIATYEAIITRLRFQLLSAQHGVEMYAGAEVVMTDELASSTRSLFSPIGQVWVMQYTDIDTIGIYNPDDSSVFGGLPAALVADARKRWLAEHAQEDGDE